MKDSVSVNASFFRLPVLFVAVFFAADMALFFIPEFMAKTAAPLFRERVLWQLNRVVAHLLLLFPVISLIFYRQCLNRVSGKTLLFVIIAALLYIAGKTAADIPVISCIYDLKKSGILTNNDQIFWFLWAGRCLSYILLLCGLSLLIYCLRRFLTGDAPRFVMTARNTPRVYTVLTAAGMTFLLQMMPLFMQLTDISREMTVPVRDNAGSMIPGFIIIAVVAVFTFRPVFTFYGEKLYTGRLLILILLNSIIMFSSTLILMMFWLVPVLESAMTSGDTQIILSAGLVISVLLSLSLCRRFSRYFFRGLQVSAD